jgi:DNA-binding CsgD family transcriptional regulator
VQLFLILFYVLFFATGFMGGAALLLLELRVRSRLLRPLLAFQLLFLIGMGLVVVYLYAEQAPGHLSPAARSALLLVVMTINAAVYGVVIVLIRRISPPSSRRKGYPAAAEILAGLVAAKSVANVAVMAAASAGDGGLLAVATAEAWHLGGHILTALAMAAFGVVARGPLAPGEPRALRPLIRAYGLCAMVFSPIGLIEYAVENAGLPWLPYISLDHVFYLTWNVVSMSAAIRVFRPAEGGIPMLDAVPEERVRALGLSAREAEMAVLIARGLANKQIAAELNISPATVRTHIYNLYQKANARSRVELLNKLRS